MVSPERTLRVEPPTADNARSFSGPFAPTGYERTDDCELSFFGEIPQTLTGTYLRNGPNPLAVSDPASHRWLSGDGMIHAISVDHGRPVSYRNRMVRTRRLAARVPTRPAKGPAEPFNGPANAGVVVFADRLMATSDTGLPMRLDLGLNTICIEDFDARLTISLGAHPKVDPTEQTLTVISHDPFGPPWLWYLEIDASGEVLVRSQIGVDRCRGVLDFGVTNTRLCYVESPLVIGLDETGPKPTLTYAVSNDASMRVGVFERGTAADSITFFETASGLVSCVAGAFDDDDAVIIDVVIAPALPGDLFDHARWRPILERWRLDEESGEITRTSLTELCVEFATCDPRFARSSHRWIYATILDDDWGLRCIVRIDATKELEPARYVPPMGFVAGEPCFVPDGHGEGDGHLLSLCSAIDGTNGVCCIWDARHPGPPVATIALNGPVPLGLRGQWLPDRLINPVRRVRR